MRLYSGGELWINSTTMDASIHAIQWHQHIISVASHDGLLSPSPAWERRQQTVVRQNSYDVANQSFCH